MKRPLFRSGATGLSSGRRTSRRGRPTAERLEERHVLSSLTFSSASAVSGSSNGVTSVEVTGVALDSAGDTIVSGSFFGTADVAGTTLTSNGGRDLFVAKLGTDGKPIWVHGFGGQYDDRASSVAVDSAGDVFTTGFFTGSAAFGSTTLNAPGRADAFVLKLSPGGSVDWAVSPTTGSGNVHEALSVAVTPAGDTVAIGGFFQGSMTFASQPALTATGIDGFVAKFAGVNGSTIFAADLGAGSGHLISTDAVAIDPAGDVYASGYFNGAITANPSGGGSASSPASGGGDLFLVKYNPYGAFQWSQTLGGSGFDEATGLAADAAGNLFVTGRFEGSVEFSPKSPLPNGGSACMAPRARPARSS